MLGDSLLPIQVGVGVPGWCEAVHATRRFITEMPDDFVVVKLDFSNAFNCIRRDVMLQAVADQLPHLYKFCHLAYSQLSMLKIGCHIIMSDEGAQQIDSLGSLLFCLVIQPMLRQLSAPLSIAYIDDVTLGGSVSAVFTDVQ
jgi:hypothetical protein